MAETVEQAPRMARSGGTVVILGVMPQGAKVAVEPFDILFRELRILGSFINPFTHRRAADLVASGALDLDSLVTRRIGLDDIAEVVGRPAAPGEVKVMAIPGA